MKKKWQIRNSIRSIVTTVETSKSGTWEDALKEYGRQSGNLYSKLLSWGWTATEVVENSGK